jgi:hypothetical protein
MIQSGAATGRSWGDISLACPLRQPEVHRSVIVYKWCPMNIHLSLAPLVSLIAGILILVMPRLLNYIVAIYLIVIGLIGLFGTGNFMH